jgi:hypothetical protein
MEDREDLYKSEKTLVSLPSLKIVKTSQFDSPCVTWADLGHKIATNCTFQHRDSHYPKHLMHNTITNKKAPPKQLILSCYRELLAL